ncbi:MAG: TonB-dependent receptor [Gemmatimonadota bacterium]|nr:TonB-dependent receptor [Gemmatimonadota bacterium]
MRAGDAIRERCRQLLTVGIALSLAPTAIEAQGITSAALQGTVTHEDGKPVRGAVVTATAPASGTRWHVRTDASGRYFLENVAVGGPYVVDVRALGFAPARRTGFTLALGQRYQADFVLEAAPVLIEGLTVRASADRLRTSGRTGPAHVVAEAELDRLPNLVRDLSVAAALGPLAVLRPLGGISIGGQNQGFNSYQVDGGVNADLYLGRTPGGASPSGALPEVLPHAISIETVREFQVLAAPFDVRLGSFAGGLLNAVTKSGTNDFHGSLFGFLQDGNLVAKNAAGSRTDFTTWQFGGTLAGPVVRNRVHFFLNADLQRRVVPDVGPRFADTASAHRFRQILADSFRLNPGSLGPTDGHLPAQDLFAKVTLQLDGGSHLEVSQHYAHGERWDFMDVGRTFDTTGLSSVAGRSRSTVHTSRLIWSTLAAGRAQHQLIVSYARLRDSCRPNAAFPLIQVAAGAGNLIAGPNSVCPTTDVNQSALEMTQNVTIGAGPHLVTLGSHAELLHFRDPLVQVSAGRWDFASLDSLARREAKHYDRGLPSSPRPAGADFRVIAVGVYAQNRWTPTVRLTLTAGLRLDVPFLPDAPATNPALANALGIDTGRLPSGNAMWSPRLGVNYDVRGDGVTFLRGGVGLFGGPPPYRWLGNAYRESGDERVVICDGARVPPFDPNNQPVTCLNGTGSTPRISYFDRGLRLPQNLKLAFGVDRRLPWDVVAAIDFLYTRAVYQMYVSDANIGAPLGTASGDGGRFLYGTISPTSGLAAPRWRDPSFGEIYRVSNRGGDQGVTVSSQVRKRFGGTAALYAAYAYSRVRDRMSLVNFPARANFSNTPVDGSLDDRELRPSFFETPHKASFAATFDLPRRTQFALLYVGASQPPFTYVVNGDANADGIGGSGSLKNDIVYVPLNAADITLAQPSEYARLDAFIEQQPCLREQRGRIMARGSCRNGWLGVLNARLTKAVPVSRGEHVEIAADVLNVLNLIRPQWGRSRDLTTGPSVTLLGLAGWDATNDRAVYSVPRKLPARDIIDDPSSRWRVQLGTRYSF